MKIALIHSYYSDKMPSGENSVVDGQVEVLVSAGHEVMLVGRRTSVHTLRRSSAVRSAFRVATGLGHSPVESLEGFRPDVVHVHNLFPNWGRAWLNRWNGPVVTTVHNFRSVCSAGVLFRDGVSCTLCVTGNSFNGFRHACYRNSRIATVPVAISTFGGVRRDTLLTRADAVVALSPRAEGILVQAGLSSDKISVIPNFLPGSSHLESSRSAAGDPAVASWVYIGRISPEKGILRLVSAWPEGARLDIYGDGPDRAELLRDAPRSVTYKGVIPESDVGAVVDRSIGLVFPSLWPEGAVPQSYLHALAAGVPTVAVSGNAAADHILLHNTGLVVGSVAEMADACRTFDSERFSRAGIYRTFEQSFTTSAWLASTQTLYGGLHG